MGRLLDYAKMSNEVYNVPDCGNVDHWRVVATRVGGAGFKGACYTSADELVVVFAGTETSLSELPQDAIADLLLGLGLPTRQTFVASRFYDDMMAHRGDRAHVTVTGHSLGGGLSQAVGFMKTANFVSWNAPGMMQSILCTGPIITPGGLIGSGIGHLLRARGAGDRGKNYRLPRDPVSLVNTHYGTAPVTIQGGPQHTGHGIATFVSCLESTHWGQLQPFGY